MRIRHILAALTLAVAIGCGVGALFGDDGDACTTDGNCSSGQTCCAGVCRVACSIDGDVDRPSVNTAIVTLQVLTDLAPVYEFDTIRLRLDDGEALEKVVGVAMHFDRPRSVGTITQVAEGMHTLSGELLRSGVTVIRRTRVVEVLADGPQMIAVTRGTVSCADASSCSTFANECTVGVCVLGVCGEALLPDTCAPEERCLLGVGCVLVGDECGSDLDCDDAIACTRDICGAGRCRNVADDSACATGRCAPFGTVSDGDSGCEPPPCGPDSCVSTACARAECVGGACVRSPLCSAVETCCDGVCAASCGDPRACEGKAAGAVCRLAYGSCDVAEVCDGLSPYCPPDVRAVAGVECRAVAGACDVAEVCDGLSVACPADQWLDASTQCRASTLACDVAEMCNGASPACPIDVAAEVGTICRAAAAACDATERCDGVLKECPADGLVSGTVCRPTAGPCDVAELCNGASPDCPANAFVASSVVCRPSAGVCDIADQCTGTSAACPADARRAIGYSCRAPATGKLCDAGGSCDGSATCPPNDFADSGVPCRPAAGDCDTAESCTGTSYDCPPDRFVDSSVICRPAAAGNCDIAESCTGSSATCPANSFQPNTQICLVIPPPAGPVPIYCCNGSCTSALPNCP